MAYKWESGGKVENRNGKAEMQERSGASHVWIRAEKPLAVEVDNLVSLFRPPNLGFP